MNTDELEKINELLKLTNTPKKTIRNKTKNILWDMMFLREADFWSKKSHDSETHCGCVLTRDNTILSTGYNGFIRNINDTILPNKRPLKYPFMIHAELNAILNCARNGISTKDSTAYITTKPCLHCFQLLYQAGIVRIVYSNFHISKRYDTKETDDIIEAMLMLINEKNVLEFTFIDKDEINV